MKNKFLVIFTLVLCLVVCFGLTACNNEQDPPVDNRTITFEQAEVTIELGAKPVQLKAVLSQGKGVFEWSSSNTDVATIDQNGNVTAVSAGETTITVKCGTLAPTTCKVIVQVPAYIPVFVADPTGEGIQVSVAVGGTVQLNDGVKFNGQVVDVTVTYNSKDASIATVSSTGVVTGAKTGSTQIQAVAIYLGIEVHMTVTVTVV